MEISNEQVNCLVRFCGHGDTKSSEIIFFGNEEGLGGLSLETAIHAKCKIIQDTISKVALDNYEDASYLTLDNQGQEKYWEIVQEIDPDFKREAIISPTLSYQARIVRYIQERNDKWLKKNCESQNNFYNSSLFNSSDKINVSLVDLRPLPRRVESDWPYDNISSDAYLKAFQFGNISKSESEHILFKRANVLKKVFTESSATLIVGIGAKKAKKAFFEYIFSDKNILFKDIKLRNGKSYLFTTVTLDNRKINIVLFNAPRMFSIENLEEVTKEHIVNML